VLVAHAKPTAAVLGAKDGTVKASGAKAGALAVAGPHAAEAKAAIEAGALVVILVKD
jgi:hypothetical protein